MTSRDHQHALHIHVWRGVFACVDRPQPAYRDDDDLAAYLAIGYKGVMSAALTLMTADEFLLWRLDRDGTWELVDGVPQLKFDNGPSMMAGGSRRHARVASNVIRALGNRLRGGPCYPVGSDFAVRTKPAGVRQPDVIVECGKGQDDDLEATEAKVIFEVLSPSTRGTDLVRKAEEYRQLSTTVQLILMEPDKAKALLWTRNGEGWDLETFEGVGVVLPLGSIGAELPMSEAYEGVTLVE